MGGFAYSGTIRAVFGLVIDKSFVAVILRDSVPEWKAKVKDIAEIASLGEIGGA